MIPEYEECSNLLILTLNQEIYIYIFNQKKMASDHIIPKISPAGFRDKAQSLKILQVTFYKLKIFTLNLYLNRNNVVMPISQSQTM